MAIATPGRYNGTNFAAIDTKGRVAVPASFRNNVPLADNGERILWVGHDPRYPCLIAYGHDHYQRLEQEIETARITAKERDRDFDVFAERGKLFNMIEQYTLDDSGRFLPANSTRQRVKAEGAAAFVGYGPVFQIWWLPTLIDCEAAGPDLRELARDFLVNGKGRK